MNQTPKKPTALIVDDDPLILEALSLILAELDFDIIARGEDGQEAVTLFRQHQPDLTILDIEMPYMDGIDALKIIRQESPNSRIAMLTATDPKQTLDFSFDAGAIDFIRKGQDTPRLIAEIEEIKQKNFGR
ncbi:MAG: response regulator transcription factor [Magnetococcales bacterium]|nr:response regulator transcription factor [Magnetococcales bacterium]